MKELYIRCGNTEETKNFIIIGEESVLGSRDSAYKISKGQRKPVFFDIDNYSKSKELLYNHSTPNIKLDTDSFTRDYNVHNLLRTSPLFTELVKWDGEVNEGLTQSREVFLPIKYNTKQTCELIYERLESLIHNKKIHFKEVVNTNYYLKLMDYVFGNKCIKYDFSRISICRKCNGLGNINKKVCKTCDGSGKENLKLSINFRQKPYDLTPIRVKEGGNLNNYFNYPDLVLNRQVQSDYKYELDQQGDLYRIVLIPNMSFRPFLTLDLPNGKKIIIKRKDIFDGHLVRVSNILPLSHNIYFHFFKCLPIHKIYYTRDINNRRFKVFQDEPDKLCCPKCNKEVTKDDIFCKCGNKLLLNL